MGSARKSSTTYTLPHKKCLHFDDFSLFWLINDQWAHSIWPGSCDLDHEMQEHSRKLFCISFAFECRMFIHTLVWSFTHYQTPCGYGTYPEPILNQYDSFRSEPILNKSWTNLTGCPDQASFHGLHIGLFQDWFGICSYLYVPIESPILNQKCLQGYYSWY